MFVSFGLFCFMGGLGFFVDSVKEMGIKYVLVIQSLKIHLKVASLLLFC